MSGCRHPAPASFILTLLVALIALMVPGPGATAEESAVSAAALETRRPYQVRFGERIAMPDGVSLSATLVLPYPDPGPVPVILTLTPYGADRYYPLATRFARAGYAAAIVEVRGRGDSGGTFQPYLNDLDDGEKVIEWLAKQPFSNGSVAMRGGSYTGFLQWGLAARRPPALKTIIPGAPPYFGVDSPTYRGIQIPYRLRWYALVAGRQRNGNLNADSAYWQGLYAELARGEVALADLDDAAGIKSPYWEQSFQRDYVLRLAELNPTSEQLGNLTIPVLSITGMHDGAQLGTLTHYQRALTHSTDPQHLYQVIGPWNHSGVSNRQGAMGGLEFPAASIEPADWHLAWFDWILREGPRPTFLKERVTYYVLGDDRWAGRDTVDGAPGSLILYPSSPRGEAAESGHLTAEVAERSRGEDCWRYDPLEVPIRWGPYFGSLAGGKDHLLNDPLPTQLAGRGLLYESRPLERSHVIAGRPTLSVSLTADVRDTDLAVVLYELRSDGTSVLLASDMLRARHRHGFLEPPALLVPGEETRYEFEMTWIGKRLATGSRLRLMLTSPGISYLFHRNRNSGGDVALEKVADSRVATICLTTGAAGTALHLPLEAE
ncbi:CocE/NonD family hydrolase [Marinobacter salarius]|uniref:CocE/NonD family hydrolase n=1 Tax=Marinobacter salarius TaxID=1420917 RepID=UPI0032F023D9